MSAILAVCGTEFCAMVSDGRMVEEPVGENAPHIVTETLPKVRKINRNVCVGFAGDCMAAVQIVNAVDEYDLQYLTLERVVKIMQAKGRATPCQPVGVRLLIGGRGRKGGFALVSMGSNDNYEPQTQPAKESAYLIEGACSHTEVAPFLEEFVKARVPKWKKLEDVAASLDGCIAAIASGDRTVNTQYYRELIM